MTLSQQTTKKAPNFSCGDEFRKEFKILTTRVPSLWTRSYFCYTTGHISEETIQKYIEEQKNRERRIVMPSFVMEFELIAGNQETNFLEKRFNAGSNIYNLCLEHCIKQLNKLKRDKEYRKSVKALKIVNRKLEKKNLPQDEIKRLKEIKISCINKIKKLEKEYQFTENDIQKYAKVPREFIGKILNSNIVQKIASTSFNAVKKIQYGKAKKVRFKKKGEITLEGKNNKTGFIFDTKTMKLKLGQKLSCNLKTLDEKQKNCFKNRIKFCRVLKSYIRGKKRYFLQIVFEGTPETDFQIGEGEVGLDIGTSTVAISSNNEVKLLKLSEMEQETRKIRILQRSLERKRRMANPNNYDENGKVKKKRNGWKLSKNYFKELNKLKEVYRKKRVKDNQHKNILVKFILSQGDTVKTEKASVNSWKSRSKKTAVNKTNGKTMLKKRFGKSVNNNAPGTLKRKLSEKLSYFGKELIEINPFKTKASQFNHISQEFKKCSLEVRFKELIKGIVVQRDLYSAFLIKNVENLSEYNMKKINQQFDEFYEKQMKEVERIKNEGSLKFYVSGKIV